MRYLLEELGYDVSHASWLLINNKSAIQVAKHLEHQSMMKHVHRTYHWIRGHIEQNLISVSHVPGDENLANIFTKPLGRVKFTKFRQMLGLHKKCSLFWGVAPCGLRGLCCLCCVCAIALRHVLSCSPMFHSVLFVFAPFLFGLSC